MKASFLLFLLNYFLIVAKGQLLVFDDCPKIAPLSGFQLDKFVGKWYPVKQYPTVYESIARCPSITYEKIQNEKTKFSIKQAEIDLLYGNDINWTVTAQFTDNETIASWETNIPIIGLDFYIFPYILIETDYTNFAVLFSCFGFEDFSIRQLWILSRQKPLIPFLGSETGTLIAERNNLNSSLLLPTFQFFC